MVSCSIAPGLPKIRRVPKPIWWFGSLAWFETWATSNDRLTDSPHSPDSGPTLWAGFWFFWWLFFLCHKAPYSKLAWRPKDEVRLQLKLKATEDAAVHSYGGRSRHHSAFRKSDPSYIFFHLPCFWAAWGTQQEIF